MTLFYYGGKKKKKSTFLFSHSERVSRNIMSLKHAILSCMCSMRINVCVTDVVKTDVYAKQRGTNALGFQKHFPPLYVLKLESMNTADQDKMSK